MRSSAGVVSGAQRGMWCGVIAKGVGVAASGEDTKRNLKPKTSTPTFFLCLWHSEMFTRNRNEERRQPYLDFIVPMLAVLLKRSPSARISSLLQASLESN